MRTRASQTAAISASRSRPSSSPANTRSSSCRRATRAGLETWLRQEKYSIPEGAADALAPYVRDKSKFFVAKVDIKKVKRDAQGVVQLSPLRFTFDANELRLPVRLGLLNAGGKQDLIVYVIHPTSRFEVANYANTFIPTNLEVADGVRNNFPAFFAELFDATVEKMGRKVVVTEYAWQTTGCDPCPTPPLHAAGSGRRSASTSSRAAPRRESSPLYGYFGSVGADAPARALQQGDAVRGSDLPRGEAGDGRARELERHQRRRRRHAMGPRDRNDGGVNNFQGRYIIRHYWDKPGRLQGPALRPVGRPARRSAGQIKPTAAKGLATAPRGKVVLTAEVRSPVPLLGIAGKPPHRRKAADK